MITNIRRPPPPMDDSGLITPVPSLNHPRIHGLAFEEELSARIQALADDHARDRQAASDGRAQDRAEGLREFQAAQENLKQELLAAQEIKDEERERRQSEYFADVLAKALAAQSKSMAVHFRQLQEDTAAERLEKAALVETCETLRNTCGVLSSSCRDLQDAQAKADEDREFVAVAIGDLQSWVISKVAFVYFLMPSEYELIFIYLGLLSVYEDPVKSAAR